MHKALKYLLITIPLLSTGELLATKDTPISVEQFLKDKHLNVTLSFQASDNEGGLWLITDENQILHVSSKWHLRRFPSLNKRLSDIKITSILPLKKELVLLGTEGQYLLCVKGGHYTQLDFRYGLSDSIIKAIELNHETKEVIIVGQNNRFTLNYQVNKEHFKFRKIGGEELTDGEDVIKRYFRKPIQKAICDVFGDVDLSFKDRKSITNKQISQISKQLQAGDLLLKRNDYQLTNIAIPGFWTHSGIYLGSLKDLDILFAYLPILKGIKASEYIKIHYYPIYRKMLYRNNLIFEAVGDGVSVNTLRHIAGVDYFVAIRPQLDLASLFETLMRAFEYYNKPYDYLFDLKSDDALICSELIYKSLQSNTGAIKFKLSERDGEPFLSPSDIALQCIEEQKAINPMLKMVVYCGILANSTKSAFQSFYAFDIATTQYTK